MSLNNHRDQFNVAPSMPQEQRDNHKTSATARSSGLPERKDAIMNKNLYVTMSRNDGVQQDDVALSDRAEKAVARIMAPAGDPDGVEMHPIWCRIPPQAAQPPADDDATCVMLVGKSLLCESDPLSVLNAYDGVCSKIADWLVSNGLASALEWNFAVEETECGIVDVVLESVTIYHQPITSIATLRRDDVALRDVHSKRFTVLSFRDTNLDAHKIDGIISAAFAVIDEIGPSFDGWLSFEDGNLIAYHPHDESEPGKEWSIPDLYLWRARCLAEAVLPGEVSCDRDDAAPITETRPSIRR